MTQIVAVFTTGNRRTERMIREVMFLFTTVQNSLRLMLLQLNKRCSTEIIGEIYFLNLKFKKKQ
jgi:hypothetical protein